MIAGLIESHLGNSRYQVRISYDTARATAELERVQSNIDDASAKRDATIVDIESLQAEQVALGLEITDLLPQIEAEQNKPEYPGDGYDFKDPLEIDRLTALKDDLLSQYNAKLAAAASFYDLAQEEAAKPRAEDGNPDCLDEFYCEARYDSYVSGRESVLSDAESLAEQYNAAIKDLQAENRKLPHPDDVPADYYQDKDQLADWQQTVDDNVKSINDKQSEIQRLEFYVNALKVEILSLQKNQAFIERHQGADRVVNAYSNEYDESLTGVVPVELIGGNYQFPVIVASDTINGRIATPLNIKREHCFSNIALISGWLKWKQKHAVAQVQSVGTDVVATIYAIGHQLSMVGPVYPFNHTVINAATDYEYEVGDQALVEYSQFGEMTFKGWYAEPREMSGLFLLFRGRNIDPQQKMNMHTGVVSEVSIFDYTVELLPYPYVSPYGLLWLDKYINGLRINTLTATIEIDYKDYPSLLTQHTKSYTYTQMPIPDGASYLYPGPGLADSYFYLDSANVLPVEFGNFLIVAVFRSYEYFGEISQSVGYVVIDKDMNFYSQPYAGQTYRVQAYQVLD